MSKTHGWSKSKEPLPANNRSSSKSAKSRSRSVPVKEKSSNKQGGRGKRIDSMFSRSTVAPKEVAVVTQHNPLQIRRKGTPTLQSSLMTFPTMKAKQHQQRNMLGPRRKRPTPVKQQPKRRKPGHMTQLCLSIQKLASAILRQVRCIAGWLPF